MLKALTFFCTLIFVWSVVMVDSSASSGGSIKPSLQHFQFCRVGLSLGILYLSISRISMLSTSNWDKIPSKPQL
jgi:hypothetical protein